VQANAQAEGTGMRFFMSKAISNDGLCTYTHELTHLLLNSVWMDDNTPRQGLDVEFFARGLYETYWSTDPIMNLNMSMDYSGTSNRVYNESPERFKNVEDLQEYTRGMMDVLYTLDYLEAQSILGKTTAQKKKWFNQMTQTADTRTRLNQGNASATHTVDTIVNIDDTLAASLTKVEDLIDNNIVASRYAIEGLKVTGTAASNGYHVVPLFTSNYSVAQNDNGVAGDVSTRRQAYEFLAEYGYFEGMVPYISNKYLTDATNAGKVLSDTFVINKIFNGDYADMKAFKKAMFARRAEKINQLKPITITFNNKTTSITSVAQLQTLMDDAVAYDLEMVYVTSGGYNNVMQSYNTQVEKLKAAIYTAYLQETNDFTTSIYKDVVTPTPTATPTPKPTAVPTATPTPKPTAVPTVVPTVAPTVAPTTVPTTEPTPSVDPEDAGKDIPVNVLIATAGNEEALSGNNTTEGPARFVLDNKENTYWHTAWAGWSNRADHWIQFELTEGYQVEGLRYQPRPDVQFGVVTKYQVLVSNDGTNWTKVDEGSWAENSAWKLSIFAAQEVKYVRLMSVESKSDHRVFSSAAEIRLTGTKVVKPTAVPTAVPTVEPTVEPTVAPTATPTATPTPKPTAVPTATPTPKPTVAPTTEPTVAPTVVPTVTPTVEPTVTEAPTPSVTEEPSVTPTETEVPKPSETPEDKKPVTEIFTDVYNDWYKGYVQYVYDNGLMTGIKGTTEFRPNANITKAQVAQVLYNMEGQPVITNKNVFSDLKDVYSGEWYANAVAWAYSTGVVTGDLNAKKFFPNADVTREQLALMMFRYAKFKAYDVNVSSDLAGLKNAENTSDWALDGVKWAVGAGLISGVEKNGVKDLQPQGNASRAQMAAILQRFCEK
jgi:outer membrane biosynthesis protein TonB